ncbi:MAG: primosomal protein N' [bacterium]
MKEFAEIVFPLTVDRAFTYRIPPEFRKYARTGCRVKAPFGPRTLTGFIVSLKETTSLPETNIKALIDVLDRQPIFSHEMYELALWLSDYYLCPLADVLKTMLPSGLFRTSKKIVELATEQAGTVAAALEKTARRQAQILRYLEKSGRIAVSVLAKKIGSKSLDSSIHDLEQNGWVRIEHAFSKTPAKSKFEKVVTLIDAAIAVDQNAHESGSKLGIKQIACINFLRERGPEVLQRDLLKATGATSATVLSLSNKNLVQISQREVIRDYYGDTTASDKPVQVITLNQEQQAALAQIKKSIAAHKFKTFLLYGVTGSGKTQVYIEAIYKVLAKGQDAIVLVPEIALTPQTVHRFRSHFKDHVTVLHSAMSEGERFDSWRRIKKGHAKVAIGPRSAVFAPLKNIGLIVVDEEQEDSYKQVDPAPRYHARDVAVMRAKLTDAVVILGSATPSAESFYNAQVKKYQLLELKNRVENIQMPHVHLIDMLKERRLSGKREMPVLSRLLAREIAARLAKKQQIILLLNRRGFSSHIKCKECGYSEHCVNCEITLTYHLTGKRLRCHFCGYTKKAPSNCPDCSGSDLRFRGAGTQKVEETIKAAFPEARVVRMDLDTTSQKWSHDRILQDFERGKYDILLGTQMIAKGLDFQRVTLVGAINADIGLLFPDFRSSERTFQLLTQVAGRAGRKDLPGEVIIQTFSPEEFCLLCAQKHDFLRFYHGDIQERANLFYPPFGRMISILFKGPEEPKVIQAAQNYASVIKRFRGPFQILGPTPSLIVKIKNKYRWHILLKGSKESDVGGQALRQAVIEAQELYREEFRTRGVQVAVDVDPVSLI